LKDNSSQIQRPFNIATAIPMARPKILMKEKVLFLRRFLQAILK
jgi:hypothetical protein